MGRDESTKKDHQRLVSWGVDKHSPVEYWVFLAFAHAPSYDMKRSYIKIGFVAFLLLGGLFVRINSVYAEQIDSIREPPTETYTTPNCDGDGPNSDYTNEVCDYGNGGTADGTYVDITGIQAYIGCGQDQTNWNSAAIGVYDTTDNKKLAILNSSDTFTCTGNNNGTVAGIATLTQTMFSTSTAFTIPNGHGYFIVLLDTNYIAFNKGAIGQTGGGNYSYSLYNGLAPSPNLIWNTPASNYTGADFTYWTFEVENIELSSEYYVSVHYETEEDQGYFYLYEDEYLVTSPNIYATPKQHNLWIPGFASTSEWIVSAELKDSEGVVVDSVSSFHIWINGNNPVQFPNYNVYNTSSTIGQFNQQLTNRNPSSTCGVIYTCNNPSSTGGFMKDLSCNLYYAGAQVGSFLFCPPDFTSEIMNQAIGNLKTVDPFRTVFSVADLASSSLASATGSPITITFPINGQNLELVLINEDSPIKSETAKNAIFLFWRSFLYVGGAFAAIKMISTPTG